MVKYKLPSTTFLLVVHACNCVYSSTTVWCEEVHTICCDGVGSHASIYCSSLHKIIPQSAAVHLKSYVQMSELGSLQSLNEWDMPKECLSHLQRKRKRSLQGLLPFKPVFSADTKPI